MGVLTSCPPGLWKGYLRRAFAHRFYRCVGPTAHAHSFFAPNREHRRLGYSLLRELSTISGCSCISQVTPPDLKGQKGGAATEE